MLQNFEEPLNLYILPFHHALDSMYVGWYWVVSAIFVVKMIPLLRPRIAQQDHFRWSMTLQKYKELSTQKTL